MAEAVPSQTETILRPSESEELSALEASCTTRTNHEQFLEPSEFTIDNLPEGNKDSDIRDAILGLARRTGRIRVSHIGKDRPRQFPDREEPYPFHDKARDRSIRFGSGFIDEVRKDGDTWRIFIKTATHLIFDGIERVSVEFLLEFGWGSIVILEFDLHGTPSREHTDRTTISSEIKEEYLALDLMVLVKTNDEVLNRLNQKYNRGPGGMAVMLCHPHGSESTKIALGVTKGWNEKTIDGKKHAQLRFSAPVCPGSSGAYVWPMGYKSPNGKYFLEGLPYSGPHDGEQLTAWGRLSPNGDDVPGLEHLMAALRGDNSRQRENLHAQLLGEIFKAL